MSAARVAVACLLIASCSRNGTATADLPQGDDPVELDPADFGVDITHPYWPMQPGARWT